MQPRINEYAYTQAEIDKMREGEQDADGDSCTEIGVDKEAIPILSEADINKVHIAVAVTFRVHCLKCT
jgi:hypothetical protein